MDSCIKHPHEHGAGICGRCGGAWCSDCLVYSFGPKKPPLCMSCAMVAGGVRTANARPAMPKRQLKALMKAWKAAEKEQAGTTGDLAPEVSVEPAAAIVVDPPVEAAAPTQDLWNERWWEDDRQPTFAD